MSSASAVACREIFDENSQPSAEEISEYAAQLGIDPESESHLLPLARDGLMQALPAPWKAYFDDKIQSHYYYNEETKKTQWEHPLDSVYKELVKKARDASVLDDTCASVQEIPTSEDYTKNLERVETKVESDEELSTDSENHGSEVRDNQTLAGARRLTPLGRPPPSPLNRLDKKLSDTRTSPLRRSMDSTLSGKPGLMRNSSDRDLLSRPSFERPKLLFKQQSEIIDLKMHVLNSPEEENFSPLLMGTKIDQGLPLTGKGSMFLKASKSDLPSPETDKSFAMNSVTKSDPPKGILREKLSDALHKKVDSIFVGKKQPASFEEDRKSVRFKLENLAEPTLSPGSNSSSEQNDGQSSIISAAPPTVPSPIIPSSPIISTSPVISPSVVPLNQIVLTPLSARPPLPPRPNDSPREVKSLSGSERDSVETSCSSEELPSPGNLQSPGDPPSPIKLPVSTHLPRILSPLKQKPDPLPPFDSKKLPALDSRKDSNSSSNSESDVSESDSHARGTSPRRRVLRPPPGDYIKPDLFQKNFQKISDLVRPGDIETTPVSLEEPVFSEKEARPRSPMIPQKSKISINLMESIESETSIDSPDKEFANLDLNDLDESIDKEKPNENLEKPSQQEDVSSEKKSISDKQRNENVSIPQIKVPTLDFSKSIQSDSDESRKTSIVEESRSKSHELSIKSHEASLKSPQIKISPTPSLGSEMRSPRLDYGKPWSPLSTFKPLNKTVIPQIKTSDSASSLGKGLPSPRLDGVIISQGKSSSDNVVVVYQFETQDENYTKPIKSPLIPDMGTRDMIERNKADEKRRLELALQKELENIRVEWSGREKKLKAELQAELKEGEDKFQTEKRVRLNEQAERHRKEIEESLSTAENTHKETLEKVTVELAERCQHDIDAAEKQHADNMNRLQQQYREKLIEQQRQLEIENERALSELDNQLQANLAKERSRMIEENRNTIESLREEHTARINELRHDYRAEVERLRTQHACHLEEVRSRLASERASGRLHDERALQEKYKCLKEKYVRLKHDVKMSIERRNKRREMSMTTGSETEKSNSHKANQSLERCKEVNEVSVTAVVEPLPLRVNNNPTVKYNDNETSYSESNAHKPFDNNNDDWKLRRENTLQSADTSQASAVKQQRPHRRTTVAFREPPRRRRDRDKDAGAATDCQDSSDATTADEKPKESMNGHGRRRCFTRLKSASTSRLNYSPKRGEGWSSPLESLRQQLRKLDDLEDQFPDLACQPAYSLRYPFAELGAMGVAAADTAELEFVRHRALVEREGMRRARAVLKRRSDALRDTRHSAEPPRAPSEEREVTELEVALHRARALLGEKEIRLRHIERALRRLADTHPPPLIQEVTASEASSGSEGEGGGVAGAGEAGAGAGAGGAVLRSLRALHADVRDIWRALDARRPHTASPETSSCNAATTSQTRMTISAPDPVIQDNSDGGVAERARGLRAWLQTTP